MITQKQVTPYFEKRTQKKFRPSCRSDEELAISSTFERHGDRNFISSKENIEARRMASTVDADEEYARRLQAQELGGYHQVPNVEQVPLVGVRTRMRACNYYLIVLLEPRE